MLVFENLTKRYHYDKYDTVSNLTLALTDKLNTVLIDAQSGKTTLCKLVLGLEKPTSGKVVFNGADCATVDGKDLDATYLCKDLLLFKNKTALYNVAYPLILRGQNKKDANQTATSVLLSLGVDPKQRINKLSQQQQVDVVLARLFARNSTLVVIDDFLPLLTDAQKCKLMDYLQSSNCFVVHFTSNVNLAFGSVYLWHDGKIITQNIQQELQKAVWLDNIRSNNE